jgi:hypothetical protein
MKADEVKIGEKVFINMRGDLMMNKWPCINKYATVIKRTKAGLYQVEYESKLYSIALYNLGEY